MGGAVNAPLLITVCCLTAVTVALLVRVNVMRKIRQLRVDADFHEAQAMHCFGRWLEERAAHDETKRQLQQCRSIAAELRQLTTDNWPVDTQPDKE